MSTDEERSDAVGADGEPENAPASDGRVSEAPDLAATSAAATALGAAKDIAGGAVTGAAQGAAVGGAAGAVAGAARGAVVSAATSKRFWQITTAVVGFGLVLAVSTFALIVTTAAIAASTVFSTVDQNTALAMEQTELSENVSLETSRVVAAQAGLPVEIVTAALEVDPETNLALLAANIAAEDPDGNHQDLRAGAVSNSTDVAQHVPDTGAAKVAAEQARATYVNALIATGFSTSQADAIYERAQMWALGAVPDSEKCTTVTIPVDEDGLDIAGTEYTSEQVANMRQVIGIAKTMFPTDQRAAAIIGLITAAQESGFRNYANDGVYNPSVDGNPGVADPQAEYARLAPSLELPHDAVGSDHSSLGIFQQQATAGWGDYGESSWAGGDDMSVIRRLMTPTYAAGKFFTKLPAVESWQTKTPGQVAQTIQVSAFPDAYASHIPFAEAAWDQLAGTTPALYVPLDVGWTGLGEDATPTVCGGGRIAGEITWPVDVDETGMMTGYVSSLYGPRYLPSRGWGFHHGVDFTGRGRGSGVYAVAAGVVTTSRLFSSACGEIVEIAHADGSTTGYMHMTDRYVAVGDTVSAGSLLGPMGGEQPGGCTFGAHVHFTATDQQGAEVDPMVWLNERGMVVPPDRLP